MFTNNFDPVAFSIFSLEFRWYSLAYIAGILIGWVYCKKKLIKDQKILDLFDDFITYAILGIIVGGRIGYVLFYKNTLKRTNNLNLCSQTTPKYP